MKGGELGDRSDGLDGIREVISDLRVKNCQLVRECRAKGVKLSDSPKDLKSYLDNCRRIEYLEEGYSSKL